MEKAGLTREQAHAFAEAQKDVFAEALDNSLATKSDIAGVRTDVVELRGEMRAELSAARGDMGTLKWMMGVLIALAIANFAKQFF